jgi:hypothetical protein
MARVNESAASLRRLLGGLGAPLASAWADVRDRMRVPTEQRVSFQVDWISDPWVTKGIQPAGDLPTATPMYDPPDEVHEWPEFGVRSTFSAASLPFAPTRHDTFEDLVAGARAGGDDAEAATTEFPDEPNAPGESSARRAPVPARPPRAPCRAGPPSARCGRTRPGRPAPRRPAARRPAPGREPRRQPRRR